MGVTHFLLIGTLAVAGGQGVAPKPESAQSPAPGIELVPPGKDPYARIFPAPRQNPSSGTPSLHQVPNSNQELQPRVVCGTVIVSVKPEADAKMVIRPMNDPQMEYKIRKIAPRICNE